MGVIRNFVSVEAFSEKKFFAAYRADCNRIDKKQSRRQTKAVDIADDPFSPPSAFLLSLSRIKQFMA